VRAAFLQHRGDLREMLFDLYDRYERQARQVSPDPARRAE
jgi:hypothetical protein